MAEWSADTSATRRSGMGTEPITDQWVWAAMSPELTDAEKKLRDVFVNEFQVDGNAFKAAIRTGFQAAFAKDYAAKFMAETYVLQRIEAVRQLKLDEHKSEAFDKNIVRDVLRKIAQDESANHSARVAAAAKMAAILGMDKPVEVKNEHTHKGGVLMVPAIANLDDWQEVAMKSQAKLVADART